MMSGAMRRLALVLAVLLVGAGGWWLLRDGEQEDGPRLIAAAVDRGPITATVTATGTVDPVETVQVGTYVSGPVQSLGADFNTPVKKGQLLATIDPRPFQLKVAAAEADVANSRATVAKAHADLDLKERNRTRQRDLRAQGIVAQSDLDTAESEARQAEAQIALADAAVRSAEARLAEARVNLDYTRIVSPVDGVVVSRSVSVGQTVAASFQTPTLFNVATTLTKMEVSASVSESDIGGVAVGQDATFTVDAYPGSPFRGRVKQVRNSPVNVQNVVTYDVLISVDNEDLRLKPGMTANVSITTARRDDAVRIPTAALRFRPPAEAPGTGAIAAAPPAGGQTVWVPGDDGKPRPVAVTTGVSDERFTEVTGGVVEGDRVVTGLMQAAEADAALPRSPFMPSVGRRRGR
jgi:HlyD family secretion protein